MESIHLIPLNINIKNNKYRRFLIELFSYPLKNKEVAERRIKELIKYEVTAIISAGNSSLLGFPILGKGTNSLVVKIIYRDKLAVLKILRLDSSRETLNHEAEFLNELKGLGIAPVLLLNLGWALIEEYIAGKNISDFLSLDVFDLDIQELKRFLRCLLYKSYLLDSKQIDHGELSRPHRHVIVLDDLDIRFIDFESASKMRKPKNLTSIIQYVFYRSPAANYLRTILDIKYTNLINALKRYKNDIGSKTFMQILDILKL